MQSTSETWKALAARIGAPEYTPGTQSLGLYSGNDPVYLTGSGKHIVLMSGDQVIYDSDHRQIVEVYSGDTKIYSSGTIEEYGETVTLESRVTIGGTAYAANITSPKITRALTQDGPGVGNAVSAMCQFSILTDDAITRAAEVLVEQRLTDGTATSEWLPAGTFYVSKRQRDPVTGVLTLECYDALLKANAVWTPSSGAWPRTMGAVVAELAGLLGVSLDSRNVIPAANVSEPAAGTTIRDALGSVAQAGGGNWIVTPANELRLVPLTDAADAAGATADVIDVRGNVGRFTLGAAGAITGVRDTWEDDVYLTGDETGLVLDVSIPPAQAADLAAAVIGLQYQPFGLSAALYDPAAELGDYVRAGANGEIRSVLYAETVTLSPAFRGDISAPEGGELYDEYPYIGGNAKTLTLAKAYATEAAAEAVAGLDEELTQQEIFDRLTDNGAAQGLYIVDGLLYMNASYIRSGTVSAQYIDAANLHVNAANIDGTLVIGQLPSTVAEESDIPTKVSELDNDSGFQNSAQVTTIAGNVISTSQLNADNITTGAMSANRISGGTLMLGGANNVDGCLAVKNASNVTRATLDNNGLEIRSSADTGLNVDINGNLSIGKKPGNLGSIADNLCAFQVMNDGRVKAKATEYWGRDDPSDPDENLTYRGAVYYDEGTGKARIWFDGYPILVKGTEIELPTISNPTISNPTVKSRLYINNSVDYYANINSVETYCGAIYVDNNGKLNIRFPNYPIEITGTAVTINPALGIASGGTGATTAPGALDNFGIKHKTVTATTNANGAVSVTDVDLQGTRYQVIGAMCTSETALCLPVFYTTSSTNGWIIMVKDRHTLAAIANTAVQLIITYIDFGSGI